MAEYNLQYEKKAKYLINSNKYMVISTSDNGGSPWGATVFYACSDGYDFYFYSSPNSRHCTNLAENPRVSLTIFNSENPIGFYDGIQIEGTASAVPLNELPATIYSYFRKIYPELSDLAVKNEISDIQKQHSNLRFFKVMINKIYISEISGRKEVVFNKTQGNWV